MNGRPVWSVSASMWHYKDIIPAEKWCRRSVNTGGLFLKTPREVLQAHLEPLGDPRVERLFRTSVYVCLQRVARDDEVDHPQMQKLPINLGRPEEILGEWGLLEETRASCKPCERPPYRESHPLFRGIRSLKDCGKCGPCVARLELEVK